MLGAKKGNTMKDKLNILLVGILLLFICYVQQYRIKGVSAKEIKEASSESPSYKHIDNSFELSTLPKGWSLTLDVPRLRLYSDACFAPATKKGVVVSISISDSPFEVTLPNSEQSTDFQNIKNYMINLIKNTYPKPKITSVRLDKKERFPSVVVVFEYKDLDMEANIIAERHLLTKGKLIFIISFHAPSSDFSLFRRDFDMLLSSFIPASTRDLSNIDEAYILKDLSKTIAGAIAGFPQQIRTSFENIDLQLDKEKHLDGILKCKMRIETTVGCQAAKELIKVLPFLIRNEEPDFEPTSPNLNDMLFGSSMLFGALCNRMLLFELDLQKIVLIFLLSDTSEIVTLTLNVKGIPNSQKEMEIWFETNYLKNLAGEYSKKDKESRGKSRIKE